MYYHYQAICLMSRVFANVPEDWGSIADQRLKKKKKKKKKKSHTKDLKKMVLDAILLNTQYYKVRIKGKVG